MNLVEKYINKKPIKFEDLVIGQAVRIVKFHDYSDEDVKRTGLQIGSIIYTKRKEKCIPGDCDKCISRGLGVYFVDNKDLIHIDNEDIDYQKGIWSCYCYIETLDGRRIE